MLIQAAQISQNLAAPIWITGVTVTGSSANITSPLTTALNSAGNNGVSVPLQISTSSSVVGVITTGTNAQVSIASNVNGAQFDDANGNMVYGIITQLYSAYTLSFYTNVNGTQTAYSFSSSTVINFTVNYVFDFYRFPAYALIGVKNILVDQLSYQIPVPFTQALTIGTANTIPSLSYTPISTYGVNFVVNGVTYSTLSGIGEFAITGTSVSFSSVNAGFTLQAGWEVFAQYFHY